MTDRLGEGTYTAVGKTTLVGLRKEERAVSVVFSVRKVRTEICNWK